MRLARARRYKWARIEAPRPLPAQWYGQGPRGPDQHGQDPGGPDELQGQAVYELGQEISRMEVCTPPGFCAHLTGTPPATRLSTPPARSWPIGGVNIDVRRRRCAACAPLPLGTPVCDKKADLGRSGGRRIWICSSLSRIC